MTNTYKVGQLVRLSAAFTDSDSAAADPTAVSLYYKDPSGTIGEWVYTVDTDIVKDSTGNYHADIGIDEAGRWRWRWTGTGAVQSADEGYFEVSALTIST